MGKSLSDYNIEQSSSFNLKNIKWTQKNNSDTKKSKHNQKTSPFSFDHILMRGSLTNEDVSGKLFQIGSLVTDKQRHKKSLINKRFQNSSVTKCKIEQGFKRPGR